MRRRTLVIILIPAALAVSCSRKEAEKTPAETPPVDKGTPGEVADETPPQAMPDRPSTPPATPAVAVDCELLFTPEDIARACGGDAADIEVRRHAMENGTGATTCMRQAGPKTGRVSSLHLAVNSAPGSPDAARALLELSGKSKAARKVEVGDGAYLVVREVPADKQTVHDLEAVKGALWFKVGYEVNKGEKKPLCTDQGLVELGKAVASKLP
jgi:hypothetical protein